MENVSDHGTINLRKFLNFHRKFFVGSSRKSINNVEQILVRFFGLPKFQLPNKNGKIVLR